MLKNYNLLTADNKDFKDKFSIIKNEVLLINNFNFEISEKDIDIFLKIINNYGLKILYNISYILKRQRFCKIKDKNLKNFLLNQIILSFIYLYYNSNKIYINENDDNYDTTVKDYKNIYNRFYNFVLNLYSSNIKVDNNFQVIDINDISELFRFNIALSLKDLIEKNFIFNISIIHLTKFFIENEKNIKDLKPFTHIFEQIYTNLLMNKNKLFFLKRDKNIDNFSIFKTINITCSSSCDEQLKELIFKTLDLIYINNYSSTLSKIIINDIKEGFYELKSNYDRQEIIKCIKYLKGKTEFIDSLFINEENLKKDLFMPSTYFFFDGSTDSGINYNPNIEIIKKSFTLVFSFKAEDIIKDKIFPLITFVSEKNDIILSLTLKNKQLFICDSDFTKMQFIENISIQKSYLVVVEYNNKLLLNEKIKISINGNKKEISSININPKLKTSVKVGFLPKEVITYKSLTNVSNFNGIIGPIIFFNSIIDDKEFATNIFKLKGKYDSILLFNSNINLINYFYYEPYDYHFDKEFIDGQNYFKKISKTIDDECFFTLCPISMINNEKKNSSLFIEDIYQKNNKVKFYDNEIFPNFNTLKKPSSKLNHTFANKYYSSITNFVQYDGIHLLTLIIEYFYNLLRMLIDEPKEEKTSIANEINNALCHILNIISSIFYCFKIEYFLMNDLNTLGFSLKKLMFLLIDIQPLNPKLVETIKVFFRNFIEHYKNVDYKSSGRFILSFMNKLFVIICSCKFFDMTDYKNCMDIFLLFNSFIKNSENLINLNILTNLLSFSFILNPIALDRYNNKPSGFTGKNDIDYKNMKLEYKNLLKTFISKNNNFGIYINFIQEIFKKDKSILEKYKLMKLYYENHDVNSIYGVSIEEENESKFFGIFNKGKNQNKKYILTKEDLLNIYKKRLAKLIDITPLIEQKNEKSFELLKSIFILLIYEHQVLIPFNLSINNYNKENLNLTLSKNDLGNSSNSSINLPTNISFFSTGALEKAKDKIKDTSNSSLLNLTSNSKTAKSDDIENEFVLDISSEENNKNLENEYKKINNNIENIEKNQNSILDILLNSSNFSFYIIKALFSCFCEQWDKNEKLKFIKNLDEEYEKFDMCFGEFNKFKKFLFSQYLKIIEFINEEVVLEKSLKLIFKFMEQIISKYKTNQNNLNSKIILLHLFESKSIINNFFDFSISNEIITKKPIKEFIKSSINNINNNVLSYHPKPFIFSYIRKNIKNGNLYISHVIKNICEFIIECLKRENLPDLKINNYLYFNEIHFIKTLSNSIEKNPDNSHKILLNENFELLQTIYKLVQELSKNQIFFDLNIYTFNPKFSFEVNKMNDKKEIKILQSSETKVLSNQNIFFNIFRLALISTYIMYITPSKDLKNIESIIFDYYSNFFEKITFKGHFISYYFDLLNPFFQFNKKKNLQNLKKDIPENINLMINKEINNNYKFYFNGNPIIRDARLISICLLLFLIKYKSKLIFCEKFQKDQNQEEIKYDAIKSIFIKFISYAQNDILSLNLSKIKEDKKYDIFIEKEESRSKIFKEYNKTYYKYLLDIIMKNKSFDIESIIKDLETKFIDEENENYKKSLNFLKRLNSNDNNSSNQKNNIDKKDNNKVRKDSYNLYYEDKILLDNLFKKNNINNNNENKNQKISMNEINNIDFENAKYPILCTKRDLILKKFGVFFYKDYFRDNKFMKMKKLFFYQNNPENPNNNYQDFYKMMKNKYPFIIKNFSNNNSYFPRMFYRPYSKIYENKYFSVSHSYFDNKLYEKSNKNRVLHLEYGHGLLNQTNFNLFSISNNNEDYSFIMNESTMSNSSNSDDDKYEIRNTVNNEDLEDNLKIFENKIQNNIKLQTHLNAQILRNQSVAVPQAYISKKNNIRNPNLKKSVRQKSSINIFDTSNKKEKRENKILFECELISPKNSSHGIICLNKNFFIYQVDSQFDIKKYQTEEKYLISSSSEDLDQSEKQIIIPYNLFSQIIYRKFLFFDRAFEIFLFNGKSYFFNLYKKSQRNECAKLIKEKVENKNKKDAEKFYLIEEPIETFSKNKYMNNWLEGKISTLEYLLLVNKFSDRSYNVLTQYLVLPWILTDFNNIYKKENYRNMSLPMPAQTQEGLDAIISAYESKPKDEYRYYFQSIYSSSLYINIYLIRTFPYAYNQIKYQGGSFDSPSRQFDSIQDMCKIFKEEQNITIELIPEFYFVPEIFLNLNYCFYGKVNINNKNILINNVKLGDGFRTISELIFFHQSNLNSEKISSQINKWIDNIFGENQITDKKNVINSFPKECYEHYMKEEIEEKMDELKTMNESKRFNKRGSCNSVGDFISLNTFKDFNSFFTNKTKLISEIKESLMKTYFFGQCPTKLFNKSHPYISLDKKADKKVYNLSNIDNLHVSLKNGFINIPNKDLLFMKESNGNYFYILLEHQILVFNKLLKQINNLSINYISKIIPPFSYNYDKNNKNVLKSHYIYKYLIFDILDCKYFFVAGYLDNSFRIYTKDKEKDIMYSVYTESKVTCIKNIPENNIFFTGHQNGKIIKWKYNQNNKDNSKKDNMITVNKISSIYAHESYIKCIEINYKFEFLVSGGDDGIVFIRKLYDFELLSYIKFNKFNNDITDINLHNQIIIISIYKIKKKTIYIYSYSLNGLKLGKIFEQIKMPISIKADSDEIFVFGNFNIYLVKASMSERTSLTSLTNNYKNYFDEDKDDMDDEEEEDEKDKNIFNENLNKSVPISYFYDIKYHILFCLFENGQLHRVNLIKNV